MLTELGEYDLAIEIGLNHNLKASAYCLSKMIEVFKSKDIQDDDSSIHWNKIALSKKNIDEYIEPFVARFSAEHVLDLAKFLIGSDIDLPLTVSLKLLESPLVCEVISCFLCGSERIKLNLQGLYDFVNLDLKNCIIKCA